MTRTIACPLQNMQPNIYTTIESKQAEPISQPLESPLQLRSEPTLFGKTADDKNDGRKKQKDKDCLCGRRHRFEKCYYLIPDLAPPTWKEGPEIRTKIDNLLKRNRRLAQAVERATKRANVDVESAGNYFANYADADAGPKDRY